MVYGDTSKFDEEDSTPEPTLSQTITISSDSGANQIRKTKPPLASSRQKPVPSGRKPPTAQSRRSENQSDKVGSSIQIRSTNMSFEKKMLNSASTFQDDFKSNVKQIDPN